MPVERILITVRTYPSPSRDYVELVCTGGISDLSEWRRLYPIPLRYLEEEQQFKTYDVVTVDVSEGSDTRPETRRPNLLTLKRLDHLDTWASRCAWVNPTILPSVASMRDTGRTLCPVAVEKVLDFVAESDSPEWSPAQLEKLKQQRLFEENKELEKIPYTFRFIWKDTDGIEHRSRIISWEVCQTWRQWRHRYEDTIKRMRDKWLDDICSSRNRLSFFMGNYAQHPQHLAVTGIFHPPKDTANDETLW
ncbi:MAG: hypothetical protein GC162_04750 [Planctomycetes bacterium]|nr:hypothetical protein [Planctomycetota bacterium]